MRECSPLDVLSNVLDDLPDMAFAFSADARHLYVNKAAGAFLGDDPLDVIGSHWRDMGYPAEVMEPIEALIVEVAETCTPARHRFTSSPERGARTFDMSLTPLWCDDEMIAVLAIAHDISEFTRD